MNEDRDRFSDLPEDVLLRILSLLPTKLAARTSLLAPRFRHLWETCSTLEINTTDFRRRFSSNLLDLADRTLLHRNPPSPLHSLSLCLDIYHRRPHANILTSSYISSLLAKAGSLGLRHLTVQLDSAMLPAVLPLILSISSLESLSLDQLDRFSEEHLISSPVTLTHLKRLSIYTFGLHSDRLESLNQLLLQLNALEDLNLTCRHSVREIELKLITVKRLKLVASCNNLIISAPSLEFFEFKSDASIVLQHFHGDMPLLRKAVMRFERVYANNVPAMFQMLMTVSRVEELHIDIAEGWDQTYIFHALLVNSVDDPPIFIKLKHFHLEICFHEFNMEDLVTIIQHSPALESLDLVRKPPDSPGRHKRKGLWRSMLPRNVEGNYRHAYFKDLHIAEKKDELLIKLNRKQSSKRGKT